MAPFVIRYVYAVSAFARFVLPVLLACSSAPPPQPAPTARPAGDPIDAAVVIDAPPDAGPSAALAASPAWIFRFSSPDRTETWTLRTHAAESMLDVETAANTVRYLGTATDGDTIEIRVATATAKLTLDCKKTQRKVGKACNDAKAPKRDVLDCYHPDFKEPMPFGTAPGIEYSAGAGCTGYRLVAP